MVDRIISDPIISTTLSPPPLLPTERDPLLPRKHKKPFYRARPLWLVPFALTAALTRGMTLASRVQVFTELSCNQLYDDYNHTIAYHHSTLPSGPSLYFSSLPDDGITEGDDPRVIPGNKCVSDPAVQAGAARLQTITTTTMGALSALTTGWWGQWGERHGRTRVLAVSTFGLFLTDLTFILVSTPHSPLAAHSHKLLILAPIIEGSLGGWSSLMGANTAYIADCTSPGSRSTIFARFMGVSFTGIALGPIIGAWLIKHPLSFLGGVGTVDHPLQSVTSVFWVAVTCSFVNLLLVLFVFPESLPAARRAANRKGKNRATTSDGAEFIGNDKSKHTWTPLKLLKSFLSPLAVFLPSTNVVPIPPITSPGGGGETPSNDNHPRLRKDWSLTFLAFSFFFHMLATGIFQIKYLYAEHVYEWSAEQLSYYISIMGASRAAHLVVLLPFLLATFKPVRRTISGAVSTSRNASNTTSSLLSEIHFDLSVVRCSMLVDLCSHLAVVFFPLPPSASGGYYGSMPTTTNEGLGWGWGWGWSESLFVGATSLACVGAGVMPAVQSLALLCTMQARDSVHEASVVSPVGGQHIHTHPAAVVVEPGKLFGALAVLQAIGQMILGPMIFGMIYSSTVASYPKMMFVVAAGLVGVAGVLTGGVRPALGGGGGGASGGASGGGTAKTNTTPTSTTRAKRGDERRGRSRVSKDLRGGAAGSGVGSGVDVGVEVEAGAGSGSGSGSGAGPSTSSSS